DPELRFAATPADWQVGRTDTAARCVAEAVLDDAVFQRVERDDGQPAARLDELERVVQAGLELAELVVDGDPQRLEGALGRVALAEARGRRDRGLDHLDQLERALERLALAAAHDAARDLAREALLAEAPQDARDLALVPLVDDLGGRQLA